jgi:hypothetical protein
MDPTQRKILLVALGAAVVFVAASFALGPGSSGETWWALSIGGHYYGLVQSKSWMFLELGPVRFHIPFLVAAGLVTFVFIGGSTVVVMLFSYVRRLVTTPESHQGH